MRRKRENHKGSWLSRANTRCRSLRLQFKRVIRCYCMGRNYLIEAFILVLRFPLSHGGVCAAMTSLRLPPNTSHSMEVRSTMTTITMLEGEVTVTLHRCSPTVTTYMELIRSGSLMWSRKPPISHMNQCSKTLFLTTAGLQISERTTCKGIILHLLLLALHFICYEC